MGGRIELQSQPGQGSCFALVLPLGEAHQAYPAPVPLRLRVAWCEPHPGHAAALDALLQRLGCHGQHVADGKALRAFMDQPDDSNRPPWLLVAVDSAAGRSLLTASANLAGPRPRHPDQRQPGQRGGRAACQPTGHRRQPLDTPDGPAGAARRPGQPAGPPGRPGPAQPRPARPACQHHRHHHQQQHRHHPPGSSPGRGPDPAGRGRPDQPGRGAGAAGAGRLPLAPWPATARRRWRCCSSSASAWC